MMKTSVMMMLVGVMVMVSLPGGEGIKCYVCKNAIASCGDLKDAEEEECGGSCMKAVIEALNIERQSCSPVKYEDMCLEKLSELGKAKMCSCNTDFCNGGLHLSPAPLVMLLALLLGALRG